VARASVPAIEIKHLATPGKGGERAIPASRGEKVRQGENSPPLAALAWTDEIRGTDWQTAAGLGMAGGNKIGTTLCELRSEARYLSPGGTKPPVWFANARAALGAGLEHV